MPRSRKNKKIRESSSSMSPMPYKNVPNKDGEDNSQDTKNLLSQTPAYITFAKCTPPGVLFDGVEDPSPGIVERIKLPYENFKFLGNKARYKAQINYIMWVTGIDDGSYGTENNFGNVNNQRS